MRSLFAWLSPRANSRKPRYALFIAWIKSILFDLSHLVAYH
jgi:hypothetical protein